MGLLDNIKRQKRLLSHSLVSGVVFLVIRDARLKLLPEELFTLHLLDDPLNPKPSDGV